MVSTNSDLEAQGYSRRNFGHMTSPSSWNSVSKMANNGFLWCADNDAFLRWDESKYRIMIDKICQNNKANLVFLVVPDSVGDAIGTTRLWEKWHPELAPTGLPLAYVAQDGAESVELPWDQMACLFVGGRKGDVEWKLSVEAELLVAEAREKGKWVHMGRVNSYRRFRHAWEIGCDSVDGTNFSMFPKHRKKADRWLNHLKSQATFLLNR